MSVAPRETQGGVRAAGRALEILLALARRHDYEAPLEEIASAVGLAKSTTHRLLETLVEKEFVLRARGGTYRLGVNAALVGSRAIEMRRPREEVWEILFTASRDLNEPIGLSVLHGWKAVIIEKVVPPRALVWNIRTGVSMPAHATAAGKVLLAGLAPEEVEARYIETGQLEACTIRTVTSFPRILAQLEETRENGFAVDDEELELGLRCVAVPAKAYAEAGTTHALAVSVPASRMTLDQLRDLVPLLRTVSESLSGYVRFEDELS